MKRFITALLAVALLVPAGLPVDAQFPFPVAHFSDGGSGGGGGGANPGCCATEFDGSNDYLSHTSSTGWTDSEVATGSVWFKRAANGTRAIFAVAQGAIPQFTVAFDSNNKFQLTGNDGFTGRLNAASTTAITDTDWHHVVFSFDLNNTSNRHVYLDDTAETMTWLTYSGGSTIQFDPASSDAYFVGASAAGNSRWQGALSELWLDLSYLDLSVESNRRKFITAGGLPEDLGSDGSTPLGTQPEVYMGDVSGTNDGSTSNYGATGSPAAVDGPNPS